MTISYSAEVTSSTGFGCFLKLLRRWRGSIYKLIWPDVLLFLILYYICAIIYRVFLDDEQRLTFESIVSYCHTEVSAIPLSFVLGFYVALVLKRWWDQFQAIPLPDPLAVFVSSLLHGQDERGRIMRRSIMRYAILAEAMVLASISPSVKKLFPTYDHMIAAGLMTESEKAVLVKSEKNFQEHTQFWMPITWAGSVVTRARKEGRLHDDFSVKTLIDELNRFRHFCLLLLQYDNISIPLVYTQVVTLVVYLYFFFNIMGSQWTYAVDKSGYFNIVDYYFPVFITLEFFFYVGWLKVAETLINPFGDDDDDFEISFMIDRDLQVSYFIVDEMHHKHPELMKDHFWDRQLPNHLPYFNKSKKKKKIKHEEPPKPSTDKLFKKKKLSANTHATQIGSRDLRTGLGFVSSNLRRSLFGTSVRRIDPPSPSSEPVPIPTVFSEHESMISASYMPMAQKPSENIFDSSSSEDLRSTHTAASEFDRLRRDREKKEIEEIERYLSTLPPVSEFDLLREERERERNERRKQSLRRHTFRVDNFHNFVEIEMRDSSWQSEQTVDSVQPADSPVERGSNESSADSQTTDEISNKSQADDENSNKSKEDDMK